MTIARKGFVFEQRGLQLQWPALMISPESKCSQVSELSLVVLLSPEEHHLIQDESTKNKTL